MRFMWNILLKGLAAVVPVGLTFGLVYWLGVSIERVLRPVITAMVPEQYYWPGMGLVTGLVLLFFIGLAVNAWLVRRLLNVGENVLERIPLIKSIYGALRDFMDYFSTTQQHKDLKQVVMVSLNEAHLIGFLTSEHVTDMPVFSQSDDIVAVYLPMSYQVGGYTVYLPRSRVEPLDMSIEDAMRRVLTAGLSKSRTTEQD
jgi:uncharacterized membrane protein